ncbi:hypothetical protein AX14_012943 [Amanita brunnescens Koide BX004]|nr:hypothetical protein AX14_012943 [Amanita brunnescens Koide BX004]
MMFDLAKSDIGKSNRIYSENEILVIQNVMRYAEQVVVDDHFFRTNANVPSAGHSPFPEYAGFVGDAQDFYGDEDEEDSEEDTNPLTRRDGSWWVLLGNLAEMKKTKMEIYIRM